MVDDVENIECFIEQFFSHRLFLNINRTIFNVNVELDTEYVQDP